MGEPAYNRIETGSFGKIFVSSVPGAPVAYTWQTGAVVIDSLGRLYRCTAGGTPGTWTGISTLSAQTIAAAASISIDASLGSVIDITLAGAANAIAPPTNPPATGSGIVQRLVFRLRQDATGSRTVTWNAVFHFGSTLTAPVLTTTPNKTDIVEFLWNDQNSSWDVVLIAKGV